MSAPNVELLLVEDVLGEAELMQHALAGCESAARIHHVRDGAEALDFLFCRGAYTARTFHTPPRLVILDLKLPKVDGLDVLRMVKADTRTRAIPVVLLTSSALDRDVGLAYRLGANSYVHKSLDFTEFRETMRLLASYWLTANIPAPAAAFVPDPA